MKQERKVIEQNAIVVFDGDVNASKLNILLEEFQGVVIINGKLFLDESLNLTCDLHVAESIDSQYNKNIHIEGNLYCEGLIDCYDIFVSESLFCGEINSTDITVGEDFLCTDDIMAYGNVITVAGDLECSNIETGNIYVLGRLTVENAMSAETVKIGY